MDKAELPQLPFERKTKRWGMVTVLDTHPTESGGLVKIAENDHMEFWARAKDVLGVPLYR